MKYSLHFLFSFFLSVSAYGQVGPLEIWQIQGSGRVSPYAGQEVLTTTSVITAVGSDFLFVQSPDERADDQALTSDGLYVATTQAAARKVGELVQIQGTVREEHQRTQIGPGNVLIVALGTTTALPAPVILNASFPSGAAGVVPELESVEGMRVQFSGITAGPASFESLIPVVARSDRPFREPGIAYPGLPDLPVWDGNPEIFQFVPAALGQPNNRFVAALTPIEATGVMDQQSDHYLFLPATYAFGAPPGARAVRPSQEDEWTLGSLNLRLFLESDDDFNRKARKTARYIVELLRGPDLLAVQEAGSASALTTLSFYIRQLSPELDYTPLFLAGNDDIHTAYLVRNEKFTDISLAQLGKQELMPGGGILFDRPPLLFQARLNSTDQVQISVLNLHLRSLLGIEGSNESFVREKRYRQSIAVAEMVQQLRDQNLLLVGDLNAYPFTDGYVDVLSLISGGQSLGAQYPTNSPVSPPLLPLMATLPHSEQYSYVFSGSAQLLDHALAAPLRGLRIEEIAFARANADFPDAYAPNEQLLQRTSDHDGFVVYLQPETPNSVWKAERSLSVRVYPNPIRAGQALHLEVPSELYLQVQLATIDGKAILRMSKQKGQHTVMLSALPPGSYYLTLYTDRYFQSRKVIVLPSE